MELKNVSIVLVLSLGAPLPYTCELTDEYKAARTVYVKKAQKEYNECTNAVSSADYWYKYTQCLEAGDGENVGGGCGHLSASPWNKYESLAINNDFCNALKPSSESMQKGFRKYVKAAGIVQCK